MKIEGAKDALRLIMKTQGLLQRDLANAFGVTGAYISMLAGGKRDLRVAQLARYVDRLGWEIHITPKPEEDDPVKRRSFLAVAASVTFVPSSNTTPYQDPAYVRDLAARLRSSLDQLGGISLAPTASRYITHCKAALRGGNDLQAAASELSRAASQTLRDAHQSRAAEEAGALALALARRSGDAQNTGLAYEDMCVRTTKPDPDKAAHYAQLGLGVPELSAAEQARLHARFATAVARRARKTKASEKVTREAIDAALAVDVETQVRALVLGSAGLSLARHRRFGEADAAFQQSVHLFGDQPLLAALWQKQQIAASLRSADLSRAASQIIAFARNVPLVHSFRVDSEVREILRLTGQWNNVREIREAREYLAAAGGLSGGSALR